MYQQDDRGRCMLPVRSVNVVAVIVVKYERSNMDSK